MTDKGRAVMLNLSPVAEGGTVIVIDIDRQSNRTVQILSPAAAAVESSQKWQLHDDTCEAKAEERAARALAQREHDLARMGMSQAAIRDELDL